MNFAEAVQTIRRLDGWSNVLTGLGTSRDKRTAGEVTRVPAVDFETLVDLYRGSDMAARIVERPASAMVREWLEIQIADQKDAGEAIDQDLARLDARAAFRMALEWEGAFGGSALLLGINNGVVEDPAELTRPLDPAEVDSIDHLTLFASKEMQAIAYYANPLSPNFGMPAAYRIVPRVPFSINGQDVVSFGAKNVVSVGTPSIPWSELPEIHESRLLVFPGIVVDRRQRLENWGWGDSRLMRCIEILRDFDMSFAAASHLLQDFAQATLAIPGLLDMLAQDDGKKILERAQILDMTRSVARILLLDGGDVGTGAGAEVFKRETTPLSGVPDILEKFMLRLAAAADMPVTVLIGQSPSGMNATGESDTRNWYDHVKEMQSYRVRPNILRLVNLMMSARRGPTGGKVYPLWSPEFKPLWQESEKERADTRKVVADTDRSYFDMGALSGDEIRKSRFGGDGWQMETQLDKVESKDREAFGETDPAEGEGAEPSHDPAALAGGELRPAEGGAGGAQAQDLQALALNGAQISGMMEILAAVADGTLPQESAIVALCASFPFTFTEEKAGKIVRPIKVQEKPDPLELAKAQAAGKPPMPGMPPGAKPPVPKPAEEK